MASGGRGPRLPGLVEEGEAGLVQLEQRLSLFDDLIGHLDPQALEIDLVDPDSAIIAG